MRRRAACALPAYAIRATKLYRLLIDDQLDVYNRSQIVHQDVGPENVNILFRADAIVIFDFSGASAYSGGETPEYEVINGRSDDPNLKKARNRRDEIKALRYKYMNAFLTCFNSTLEQSNKLFAPVSGSRYMQATKPNDSWSFLGADDNELGISHTSMSIPLHRLQNCMALFRAVEGEDYMLKLDMLDLFYRVCFHEGTSDTQSSLALGWVVAEKCQNILWERFIEGGYLRINPTSKIQGNRKKMLLNDIHYTASIKSQILAIAGVYSDSELALLDEVRKKRNDFMHNTGTVEIFDARKAQIAAARNIRKAFEIKLNPFGDHQVWDYGG